MANRCCKQCGLKLAQEHGLCRSCSRAAGDTRTTREREAVRILIRRQRFDAAQRADRPPTERRTIVVGHREYEVVWDGTQ